MPEASDGSDGAGTTALVPNQLASLVPTFDPAKDEIVDYTKKVQLLMNMWPEGKWTELSTRLILGCTGTAFQKLQLHSTELTENDKKSIQRLIELLGGQWGQIPLERKYEAAEKALYRLSQKSDETNDSYLARADVAWQELKNKEIKLEDLQAYITLRGSSLSGDDKKRAVIDSEASTDGKLTMNRVSAAIRMLGAGFFQEVTSGKKTGKLKTYDSAMMTTDTSELEEPSNTLHADASDEMHEDELFDVFYQEGDEDAVLITDFENAAADVIQQDEELAGAFNAYTEARRRLSEKVKSRGFWPISKGKPKGSFKGVKGKFQKGHQSSRRLLQQRILTSACRICGKIGHWRAECPNRTDVASSNRPQAPTSFVQVQNDQNDQDSLPLEFLNLPSMESTMDASQSAVQVSSEPPKRSFDHLSMMDLEETVIDFGNTHRGRKYIEMWNDHQDWIAWFTARFEKSGKESHQKLLHFIQLKVERAELTGEGVQMHSGPKQIYMQPKMKAKAVPKKPYMVAVETPLPIDLEEEEDLFEFLPEAEMDSRSVAATENAHPLESRVNQMEAMLGRILAHLEQQNVESQ
eukprot:s855_g40.t1